MTRFVWLALALPLTVAACSGCGGALRTQAAAVDATHTVLVESESVIKRYIEGEIFERCKDVDDDSEIVGCTKRAEAALAPLARAHDAAEAAHYAWTREVVRELRDEDVDAAASYGRFRAAYEAAREAASDHGLQLPPLPAMGGES